MRLFNSILHSLTSLADSFIVTNTSWSRCIRINTTLFVCDVIFELFIASSPRSLVSIDSSQWPWHRGGQSSSLQNRITVFHLSKFHHPNFPQFFFFSCLFFNSLFLLLSFPKYCREELSKVSENFISLFCGEQSYRQVIVKQKKTITSKLQSRWCFSRMLLCSSKVIFRTVCSVWTKACREKLVP